MTLVLVTGGFDPLHSGHIKFFKAAKELGSKLCVGLNSDDWLTRKKGKPFMPIEERIAIIKELRMVDVAIEFIDKDDTTNDAIAMALQIYDEIIFANGGDRHNENTPEYIKYKDDDKVTFAWGIGGVGKQNSSSWILKDWDERDSLQGVH